MLLSWDILALVILDLLLIKLDSHPGPENHVSKRSIWSKHVANWGPFPTFGFIKNTCGWIYIYTYIIYTNGPSSILSSCFRQTSRNYHLISSLLHGSWIGVKSIILAYTHFRVIKKKTTKLLNNIRFYDSEFSWCINKTWHQYQSQLIESPARISGFLNIIDYIFNIYDLQLPTISVPPFLPAFSWCQPRSRSEPRSCNAWIPGMGSHGLVEEFSTRPGKRLHN